LRELSESNLSLYSRPLSGSDDYTPNSGDIFTYRFGDVDHDYHPECHQRDVLWAAVDSY
jgi:hypothetical protein